MSLEDITTNLENVCSLAAWRQSASKHHQELSLLPAGSSFQVQILGDALAGQSIQHGDLIDCERTDTLEQGQLGLLKTPYGLMLRLFYSDDEVIRLEPASPQYATLYLPPSDVEIIARPIRLERRFTAIGESEMA